MYSIVIRNKGDSGNTFGDKLNMSTRPAPRLLLGKTLKEYIATEFKGIKTVYISVDDFSTIRFSEKPPIGVFMRDILKYIQNEEGGGRVTGADNDCRLLLVVAESCALTTGALVLDPKRRGRSMLFGRYLTMRIGSHYNQGIQL